MNPWLACQERRTSTGIGSGVFSVRFPRCGWLEAACGTLLALVAGACLAQAQWLTQEIALRPGWNAVHLSVQPAQTDCGSVLANLSVESVWMWSRRAPRLQFTTDPSQLLPRNPDWLFWLPASHPQASLGTLFSIREVGAISSGWRPMPRRSPGRFRGHRWYSVRSGCRKP